jgi:hypothetical protein
MKSECYAYDGCTPHTHLIDRECPPTHCKCNASPVTINVKVLVLELLLCLKLCTGNSETAAAPKLNARTTHTAHIADCCHRSKRQTIEQHKMLMSDSSQNVCYDHHVASPHPALSTYISSGVCMHGIWGRRAARKARKRVRCIVQ